MFAYPDGEGKRGTEFSSCVGTTRKQSRGVGETYDSRICCIKSINNLIRECSGGSASPSVNIHGSCQNSSDENRCEEYKRCYGIVHVWMNEDNVLKMFRFLYAKTLKIRRDPTGCGVECSILRCGIQCGDVQYFGVEYNAEIFNMECSGFFYSLGRHASLKGLGVSWAPRCCAMKNRDYMIQHFSYIDGHPFPCMQCYARVLRSYHQGNEMLSPPPFNKASTRRL